MTSDIRDEIARVLGEHTPRHTEYARDPDTLYCQPCSEARGDWVTWTTTHLADALADLLAARDRRVRAEAWDEGAHAGRIYQQELQRHAHWSHIGRALPEPIRNPYRADRIEADE